MYGSSYHAHQPFYKAALAGPVHRPPQETHSQPILRGSSSSSSSLSSSAATAHRGRRSTSSSMRRSVGRVAGGGGGRLAKMHVDDTLDYWDSDPELETAQIREASRVRRGHVIARHNRFLENETPFYSTVVEPAMALGQQWPLRPTQPKGFQRYQPGYKVPPLHEPQQRPKPLYALTVQLNDTYKRHNPDFQYDAARANPKRVLTKPSKAAKNDGYDNEDHDYILRVNDILGEEKEYQYRVIDLLGQGTFGQVVKCERVSTGQLFSVKVIKNKPAYRNQSRMEVEIVKELKQKIDPKDHHHLLQLHHTFNHKNHLCLVFELLSFNLYELIKQNDFKGLSLNLVRVFALQLLDTLTLLKDAHVIHCDLKPENVLLKSPESPTIKVIDFGSACLETRQMYEYIQSRFYRSPEVLLGLPYTSAIDMWSLGCIVAELFIGIPLFPGSSEYNQLRRIVDMLGNPPQNMLDKGKKTLQFFNREPHAGGKHGYRLKSREEYSKEHGRNELPSKQYFRQRDLPSLILEYNAGSKATPIMDERERQRDMQTRHALVNFLEGVLQLDPLTRWTPRQARYHPFITGEPYLEPYKPEKHMKVAMKHEASSASSPNGARLPDNARVTSPKESSNRSRARSMGVPTIPSHIQELAKDIQAQPITRSTKDMDPSNGRKVRPGPLPIVEAIPVATTHQQQQQEQQQQTLRLHRHTRSHGNIVGLLPPEAPHTTKATSSDTTLAPSDTSSVEKHTVFVENNTLVPIISGSQSDLPQTARKVKIAPMLKVRFGSRDSLRMPDEVHVKKGEADWLVETQSKPKGRLAHAGEAAGGLLLMRQENPEATTSSGKKMAAALKRRSLLSSSSGNGNM